MHVCNPDLFKNTDVDQPFLNGGKGEDVSAKVPNLDHENTPEYIVCTRATLFENKNLSYGWT